MWHANLTLKGSTCVETKSYNARNMRKMAWKLEGQKVRGIAWDEEDLEGMVEMMREIKSLMRSLERGSEEQH